MTGATVFAHGIGGRTDLPLPLWLFAYGAGSPPHLFRRCRSPAPAGIFAFVWLELCYHDPASPRALALALGGYTVAMLAGAARWGRGWLRTGDGFAAWFALLAAMAPLYRDDQGALRLRWPFAGLAGVEPRTGTAALVLTVLGSTAFDGVTRTSVWASLEGGRTGWASTVVATVGLVWVIAVVAGVYAGAIVIGHVAGVVVAHDRALGCSRRRWRAAARNRCWRSWLPTPSAGWPCSWADETPAWRTAPLLEA